MQTSFFGAAVTAVLVAASGSALAQTKIQQSIQPTQVQSGNLNLSVGVDYSSGKYRQPVATDITYVPVAARYEWDRWSLKLTIPYVSITGPGNVVPDIGNVGTASRTRTTQSGLGDIILGVTRNVFESGGTAIDLTGKIKFPTADADKGLGTGKTDYAVQVDASQSLESVVVFGTFGYRIYGSPSGVELHNALFGSAGAGYRVMQGTNIGLMVSAREAISSAGPERELTAYVSQALGTKWKALGYVVKGFADNSPDYGVGGVLTYTF